MKVVCKAEDLRKALNCCRLGRTPPLPVLRNVMIKAEERTLTIAGTNLEMWSETRIPADIKEEGVILLPLALVLRFLSGEKENVILEKEKTGKQKHCTIKTPENGHWAQLVIPDIGLLVEDFPARPSAPEADCNMPDDFKHLLGVTREFAAHEESRPILTGVLFESKGEDGGFELAAADGFRLCIAKIAARIPQGRFTLPEQSCLFAYKYLVGPIRLGYDWGAKPESHSARAVLTDGTHTLISQTIQGTFPTYRQLLPTGVPSMVVKCSGLDVQHRLMQCESQTVRITKHKKGGLWLVMRSSDDFEDVEFQGVIQAEITGEGKVAVNHKYLLGVSHFFTDMMMEVRTASSPIKVVDSDGKLTVLVMPMFVQWDA